MYAVGVLTQKVLLRRLPSVQVVFVSFLMGALICLPFAGDLPGIVAGGGAELWWIVYLGVFPTAVAFTTWAYALTHTDAGALSLTTFLVPGIATLVAWLTINEVPPTLSFVGGALAIVGVLMTRRKPRTEQRELAVRPAGRRTDRNGPDGRSAERTRAACAAVGVSVRRSDLGRIRAVGLRDRLPGLEPAAEGLEVAGRLAPGDPPLPLLADRGGEAELEDRVERLVGVGEHGAEDAVELVGVDRGQRQPRLEVDVAVAVDGERDGVHPEVALEQPAVDPRVVLVGVAAHEGVHAQRVRRRRRGGRASGASSPPAA